MNLSSKYAPNAPVQRDEEDEFLIKYADFLHHNGIGRRSEHEFLQGWNNLKLEPAKQMLRATFEKRDYRQEDEDKERAIAYGYNIVRQYHEILRKHGNGSLEERCFQAIYARDYPALADYEKWKNGLRSFDMEIIGSSNRDVALNMISAQYFLTPFIMVAFLVLSVGAIARQETSNTILGLICGFFFFSMALMFIATSFHSLQRRK